ncbi:MAG: universal stress protein [Cytophagales bacterium]|nr:universal stress protein [Cytophagales bacterium]
MKTILVPTDFSTEASNALASAHSLASKIGAEIILLNVIEDPYIDSINIIGESHYDPMEQIFVIKLIEKTKEKLQTIVDDETYGDISITYKLDVGNAYSLITKHITNHSVDLIVMGTKGAHGLEELLVGSLTDKVVRYSKCPVITVKKCRDLSKIKNIVFATALRTDEKPVVESLKKFQKIFGAKLHLLKAFDSILIEKSKINGLMKEYVTKFGIENCTINVDHDIDQAKAIMKFASGIKADMIAMGAHDRHGLLYLLSGRISKKVVNHAHRPIWTKAIR